MRSVRIEGADPTPLGAPKDWNPETHGHCGALFVRRETINGIPYMRSAWEVEASEAALLLAGAPMTLGISDRQHPVVQLGVDKPPPDFAPCGTFTRFTALDGKPGVRVEMLFPHAGGRRAFTEVPVEGELSVAIATGIHRCERLARTEGWVAK